MASMFANDSHSPFPKGAYSHLLKYLRIGNGDYSDLSKNDGYSIQNYRQKCMTCVVCQRPGRRLIESWETRGLGKRNPERPMVVSMKCEELKERLI